MPELPEVETMRRGVAPIAGSRIVDVHFPRCRLKPILVNPSRRSLRRRLEGLQIAAVERIGKRIVLKLSGDQVGGHALVIEPRMTGLVLLADPPNTEHLRLGLKLDAEEIPWLWFWDRRGLGTVQLFSDEEFADRLGPRYLGPDALQVTADELRDRFRSSQREIKVALLDQKSLAGIGNLYASEILHVAKVHPQQRCHRLTRTRWQSIHEAMQMVLTEAIRYEGSTLGDGTYRNALNQTGSYQNHHRVYNRAGDACPCCEDQVIERIVQAQRSTFFCKQCQRRR
ncbi:MAG: bifunctional DNA-formamidopyrimidine glycosylase/DNA-(apurinic or apyrimidinic site) lyase [Planctomycetaceae bacterium]|nr:bifunctional DNA-formamidopyrimidine glycosylase/DNA-(apurinic or apyrimidinic site) lyase [Planctomycetaceae bacterium]